jgi:hypothetical protein
MAIWFHHIKNTEKRKNMVLWARELGCCGYSKPGFPGVVIVEGMAPDVREYVARVRALQWQAMQVRAEQLLPCSSCRDSSSCCSGQVSTAASVGVVGRALNNRFTELPETGMSQLGNECKAAGLEELFLAALKLNK